MTSLRDFLRRATNAKGDNTMPDDTLTETPDQHPPLHLSGRLLLEGGPLSHGRVREALATWRDELQAYAVTLPSADGPACYRYDGGTDTARLSFVGLVPVTTPPATPRVIGDPCSEAIVPHDDDAPEGGDE